MNERNAELGARLAEVEREGAPLPGVGQVLKLRQRDGKVDGGRAAVKNT